MRDPAGRSMHDRDPTETREMGEADRRKPQDKVAPYAIAVALLFVLFVVYLLVTR
jgi:hypothetical protein